MSIEILLQKLEVAKSVQEAITKGGKYTVLISEGIIPQQVRNSINEFLQISYIREVISGLSYFISGKALDSHLINDLKSRFAPTIVEIVPKQICENEKLFEKFVDDFSQRAIGNYWAVFDSHGNLWILFENADLTLNFNGSFSGEELKHSNINLNQE